MKIKSIKILISIIIICLYMLGLANWNSINAASASIDVPSSVTEGDTITAKIVGRAEQWNLTLKANGTTIANSNNLTNEGSEIAISATGTYKTTTKGTVLFTLTGDYSYTYGNTVKTDEINISKRVTVNAKPTTNPGGSTGGNNGGGSSGGNNGGSTTTVTEPKFTSANKTVYATGDINLRSSWSTSSSATKISKGTELKLTGTSSQKVNGYVWYRVTYNGQTKYVSRDLITETNPQEKEGKSNNTNLKVLSIEGAELTPAFSANVTEYSVKLVNYKEQSLKINAEAEDEKSTVKVEGNEEIKIGDNVISITVTAEDGTTKVYKVAVTNEEKEALGLSSLVIKGVELKSFSPSKFNYEIEFKELDKLEIEAIANEEGATVEIIGNENLTEIGEHVITIMVTSADGEQIATYTITANKLAVEEAKQELNVKSILICALIALVVLVAIVILIVRYVKGNSNAEIDYVYNDNLEDNEENSEEVEETEEENQKDKKPTIDDLYADYDDEPVKKRGKGRHSK